MTIVPFMKASPSDEAYTYESADEQTICDFDWVTGLEWFDDRDREVRLIRKRWRLIEVDKIVLPDPYDDEENDE